MIRKLSSRPAWTTVNSGQSGLQSYKNLSQKNRDSLKEVVFISLHAPVLKGKAASSYAFTG